MPKPQMAKAANPWAGKIALITGASSGIGAAAARLLAAKGMSIILAARRTNLLNTIADDLIQQGLKATVISGDLSGEAGRADLFQTVLQQHGCPDVLINNAGLGWYGYASQMTWATAQDLLQINIEALTQLTLLCLPEMLRKNSGHIINLSSIAGSLPNQGVAVYAGSKSYVDSFTTALFRELRFTGVRVTSIRPGPVKTEFFEVARAQPAGRVVPAEAFAISPQRVAQGIWKALQHPRRVLYIPWFLGVSPWIELGFSWLIDQLGPMLLRRRESTN